MTKKDFQLSLIIGGAVGILCQPIISNFSAGIESLSTVPLSELRVIAFSVFLFGAPSALYVFYLLSRFITVFYQFAKFASVGVLNSFVDIGIFNLETFLYGILPGAYIFAGFKAISFLVATTNSFFWNKYWTFNSKGTVNASETSKFYVIAVVGWILNVSAFTIVNGMPHSASLTPKQWANVAVLCGIAAAFLWDFFGYKFLVFTPTPNKPSMQDGSR